MAKVSRLHAGLRCSHCHGEAVDEDGYNLNGEWTCNGCGIPGQLWRSYGRPEWVPYDSMKCIRFDCTECKHKEDLYGDDGDE